MIRKIAAVLLVLALSMMMLTACQDNGKKAEETAGTENAGAETAAIENTGADNNGAAETAGSGPDYDSAIDASFASGKLVLKEREIPKPDPDTYTIEAVPPEQAAEGWKYPDEAQIREALRTGELFILAYSPDGSTAVGYADLAEKPYRIPLIICGDRVRMIYPSRTRGAEDPERTADAYYSRFYYQGGDARPQNDNPLGIDFQGLVWSPDGRYYYAPNYRDNFMYYRSNHFIVDTQTGELIALDSFNNSPGNLNYGILHAGCFSGDGQYFYGAYFGYKYGDNEPFKIIRYDLNTFEAQEMASMDAAASSMTMLRNGEILVLEWQNKAREMQHIHRIRPDGTVTTQLYPVNSQTYFGRQAEYSPKSGWAVIQGGSQLIGQYTTSPMTGPGIQPVMPDSGEDIPLESALFVDNETGELVYVPVAERFYESGEGNEPTIRKYSVPGYDILDLELSPDGRYAAMLVYRSGNPVYGTETELKLLVIRLEDQACITAEGLDIYEESKLSKFEKGQILNKYASLRGNTMGPVLNWTEAGLLTNCCKSQLWEIAE